MRKDLFNLGFIFTTVFFIYFGVGSQWTFKAPLDLDHFNPLARSFLQGRLDIDQPATTYDLSHYQNRWYPNWGPLPALALVPIQLIMGRFVPLFYFNVFFGSLNVIIIYLLLQRLKKEFLPQLSNLGVIISIVLFALGTTHFYLSVNCGVWHLAQIVSFFPTALGIYLILKKERQSKDYFFSSSLISLALFGRVTMIFLLLIPFCLALREAQNQKKKLFLVTSPALFFFILFSLYNFARFGHPLETGYSYVQYHPHYADWIQKDGLYSIKHLPRNFNHLVLKIPKFVYENSLQLRFDLDGNSIFFFSPPLLTFLFAKFWQKKSKKISFDPFITSLWLALILVAAPILLIYSTGWIQFGYRYSLDFMVPLFLLSIFGVNGKIGLFHFLGTAFAVFVHYLGITALQ